MHKGFGAIFLAGVFHGLMMLPTSFWLHPLGWLTAAVAAAGVLPALLSLSNRIGRKRQHPARIEAIRQHAGHELEIVCRPQTRWPRPPAVQFPFAPSRPTLSLRPCHFPRPVPLPSPHSEAVPICPPAILSP